MLNSAEGCPHKNPFDRIFFGGDYNPDQWLDRPDVLARDVELMKKASINTVTLGVFAWSTLEPSEGEFNADWLTETVDRLYRSGIRTILATPSGARPRWLAEQYPEVLRTGPDRVRNLYGERHNHCFTSPVYRDKVRTINTKLAETFRDNPAVVMWHISNEYGGECHCELCQRAFRAWLRKRYGSVEELNRAWWTAFWSHTYQSFDQIESPSPRGDAGLLGLNLDWKRFVTHQTSEFLQLEIRALRDAGACQPVTTNFVDGYTGLNYYALGRQLDYISWDSYPRWHCGDDIRTGFETALQHDLMRSILGRPFLLMESSPSGVNWHAVSRLKKPGVVQAAALQAVAHGADAAQFFQIRQGRGGYEKFHGAVIDHYGGADTRVFGETAETGRVLASLGVVAGTWVNAPAAVIRDTESRWAMEEAMGPRNEGLRFDEAVVKAYRGLKHAGLNVDVLNSGQPFTGYRILAAPMLYMFHEDTARKLRSFVERGGLLLMSCWSGIVDETDLCFEGGTPHDLMDVLGLRSEEIDALPDGEDNCMVPVAAGPFGTGCRYRCGTLCDLVRLEGAEALFTYGKDFYAGRPALTKHGFGQGQAFYLCTDAEQALYDHLMVHLRDLSGVEPILDRIPEGVEIASRTNGEKEYVFAVSFSDKTTAVDVSSGAAVLHGSRCGELPPFGTLVFERTCGPERPAG